MQRTVNRFHAIENTPLKIVLLVVVGLLLLAPAAYAGITEPPPNLTGATKNITATRYSVTGVINGSLGTYFTCTSTATAAQDVAVEVYDGAGSAQNDPVATKLTLQPGETKMFGTTSAAGFSLDENLGLSGITKGAARVVSTNKGLVCSAVVADNGNIPPASGWALPVYAKTKQKGE